MDDFEYSVEISDRDWQCFFAECEECNLLSPSLAGVDSSGMSDLDDTGSMLAKRIQKVDLTAGISHIDHPIDGPPDCEGPAVEQYLSKHGVSGMESILSGSEEDLHLQSVNIFFERLKNLTEAERLAEPSQVRAGKNRGAIEEEQQCSDGQQASCSCSTLPENTPKLNSLPARGETAVGKETMRPVDTMRNINTMKKEERGFNISPEPAASNSAPKTNKSAYPETDLFIREEACAEARVNEVTQENQFHDPPEKVVGSETTRHADKVKKVDTCTSLDDVKQENLSRSQVTLSKRLSSDLSSNVEMLTNVKWKEEQNLNVLHSDITNTNKTQSQESSPSASVKRKRRKKRRLSVESVDTGHGGRTRDSEEEQYTWRGGAGLCVSEDIDLLCSHKPPNNVTSSLYSATSKEMEVNGISHSVPPGHSQYQCLPENIVRQGRCQAAGSAETHANNNSQSVTPLSQIDDSVMKAPDISGNVVTQLQPCMKLQEELTGLNKYCWLPHSLAAGVTDKSDMARQSRNNDRKGTRADSLQPSNKGNHSNIACENEQNLKCCTAEVKSVTLSIFPSADSNDPAVEVSQNDKLSAAKSVLAVEGGNSGTANHTLCQRDTEDQQQLEIDTDQYSPAPGKTRFPLSATGMISADGHNIKPQQFTTRACPLLDEMSSKATSAKLSDDLINSSPNKSSLSNSPSTSGMKNTIQQIEHPLEVQNLCKSDILSENNTTSQTAQLESTQMFIFHSRNPCPSGEITVTGSRQRENNLSISKDLLTGPSDLMPESSCCTLNTESVTGMSEICSSTSQNELHGQGEEQTLILEEHMEGNTTFACKIETISSHTIESKCDLSGGEEEVVTESKAEPREALDSQQAVFSMSSFWSEMEKLTINDILGLRMIDKAAPLSSLPPLPENEETDTFVTNDSDFFTQLDESRPEETKEYMFRLPDSVQSTDMALNSSSRNVLWESEPVPVSLGAGLYPDNMLLTSGNDVSQPVLSRSAQKCLRKISKNISVHNLHALESESCSSTREHPTVPTLDEGEFENLETFTDEHVPGEEKDTNSLPSPLTGSCSTSLMDIFQYFFSGKQSGPSQTATDNTTTYSSGGNSLPETYDHFFSGFDTESFFCPLFTTEDQTIDEVVPIFSCSRSANRTLQFPEAYDYFFASSSSDNSSVESDEEDSGAPMRVVTRFSSEASAPQMSVDVYENFYTDNDLRQNFFWKETFSFRNINFTGSIFQKQTFSNSLSLVPVRQSDRSLRRTVCPSNVLGNQDTLLPDPLLCHLEDRIARQLAQQPFRNEELQTAVSSPILLANVSALSAIRYLRKYSSTEAAPSEKKLHNALTSESFSQ